MTYQKKLLLLQIIIKLLPVIQMTLDITVVTEAPSVFFTGNDNQVYRNADKFRAISFVESKWIKNCLICHT